MLLRGESVKTNLHTKTLCLKDVNDSGNREEGKGLKNYNVKNSIVFHAFPRGEKLSHTKRFLLFTMHANGWIYPHSCRKKSFFAVDYNEIMKSVESLMDKVFTSFFITSIWKYVK